MNSEIYYFSGTGNSLVIARELAEEMSGSLISIASVIGSNRITTDADTIGIVFPSYFGDLPVIVRNFALKLEGIAGKYIFAVCNYGGGAGESYKSLKAVLKKRGGDLSASYGIHMPQNAFSKPWEKYEKIYPKCKERIKLIANNTKEGKKGTYHSNPVLAVMLVPFHGLFKSLTRNSLIKKSGLSDDASIDELVHLSDKSYSVNEKCNGCGVCSSVCPVSNIDIDNGKPVWLNRCEVCLACYNWCPNKAIQGGISNKDYFYRNPDIKVTDIMKQKVIKQPTKK